MGGKRSEEVRTGKSEACGALLKETESFQHGGIIADVIGNGEHTVSTLKKDLSSLAHCAKPNSHVWFNYYLL